MPINKTKRENGYGEKLQVKVVTVDKEKRRVECATRDGAMIFAAVWETGTVFRWPEVGETWTVRKDTGIWRMDAIVQSNITELESEHVPTTLAELPEGATRIVGQEIHMANINSEDIVSSGQITAADQSLTSHVDLTLQTPLSSFEFNGTEAWSDLSEKLTFDGVTPTIGQRVLLREQLAKVNGIYEVKYFEPSRYNFNGGVSTNWTEQPLTSTIKTETVGQPAPGWKNMPTVAAGTWSKSGWSPTSYSTVAGAMWTTPIEHSKAGTMAQLQVPSFSWPGEGRYFALWTNMPDNGTRTGYRVIFVCTATTNVYNIYIQKLTNGALGTGTAEVNAIGYPITTPFTLQMVSSYSGVSLFANNTGLLLLGDTEYVDNNGLGGIEGTGSNPVFSEFRIGPAPITGGSVNRTRWRIKRTEDEIRPGLKITVANGQTRSGTEFQVKSHTESTEPTTEFEVWTYPTLLGSWHNYGGGFDVIAYRKFSNGTVTMKGLAAAGGWGSPAPIFILPPGYRPAAQQIFNVYGGVNGASAGNLRVDVFPDGTVALMSSSTATGGTSIDFCPFNISFYADGN